VGLDGCKAFVEHARRVSGAQVLHQDFLELSLPVAAFDGVFANASLFHVPHEVLTEVLREIRACLRPGGALFASNPRGADQAGFNGERYGVFYRDETWLAQLTAAGFVLLGRYRRPTGSPPDEQPWLASVWRRP